MVRSRVGSGGRGPLKGAAAAPAFRLGKLASEYDCCRIHMQPCDPTGMGEHDIKGAPMPDAKPGDFFLGIIEFFAVLLPGAAFVYLIQPWTLGQLPIELIPTGPLQPLATFLILAFFAGHLVHALSGWLDHTYDHL
jgi:hypothetical protein